MVAAARATRSIPIVFFDAFAPIEQGLVASLAQPGANATGLAMYAGPQLLGKRLELLKSIAPRSKRLSWLWGHSSFFLNTVAGGSFDVRTTLITIARAAGFDATFHLLPGRNAISEVLASVHASGAEVLAAGGAGSDVCREEIISFVLDHRLPSAFPDPDYVARGGLLSYAVSESEYELMIRKWANYVDLVLRGTPPASLPVQSATRYELTLNVKSARAIGISIPRSVLLQATEIIQ